MLTDAVLRNDWHVVAYAPDLKEGQPVAVRLLDEDIVLWRVGERVHAWRDRCVRFPAHPTQTPPARARVTVYQAQVKYGWVWVTLGNPSHDVASFAEWDD